MFVPFILTYLFGVPDITKEVELAPLPKELVLSPPTDIWISPKGILEGFTAPFIHFLVLQQKWFRCLILKPPKNFCGGPNLKLKETDLASLLAHITHSVYLRLGQG
jgi:hypothetical protein